MITRLTLENFKRFRSSSFRLAPLTVLAGANGSGKSTLVQSLLLLRQAAEQPEAATISLNGPFGMQLGEASEMLHYQAEESSIEFALRVSDDNQDYRWRFAVPADRSLHLQREDSPETSPECLIHAGRGFAYLAAERLGPRDLLDVAPVASRDLGVGSQGEFTPHVLAVLEREPVPEPLRHPQAPSGVTTLRAQTETWCAEIIRPVEIDVNWFPSTSAVAIRFKSPGIQTDWLRPSNIGFGVSYALPIIVAALTTRGHGLFIVENPEAHLHPEGQSRVGAFLARLAGTGVQVVVETHSDHVLNGVRRALVIEGTLAPEDVVIHFFRSEPDADGRFTQELRVTRSGALDHWPPGFFDQIERDLAVLTKAQLERD